MRISSRKKSVIKSNPNHQDYENSNGKLVPSVTTILKILSKGDALAIWANNLGWNHKSYKKELEDSAMVGTTAHAFCEYMTSKDESILKEVDENMKYFNDKLYEETHNAIKSFKLWWEENKDYVKVIGSELQLSCDDYGGTTDLVCKYKGKRVLIDYKTSKSFYMTQFLQLAAYSKMYKLKYGKKIEDVAVLRLDKKNGNKAELLFLSNLPNGNLSYYVTIFDKLANLYKFIYILESDWNEYNKNMKYYTE